MELPYKRQSCSTSFITFSCAKLVQEHFAGNFFFFLPLSDIPVTHKLVTLLYYILSQMTRLATP